MRIAMDIGGAKIRASLVAADGVSIRWIKLKQTKLQSMRGRMMLLFFVPLCLALTRPPSPSVMPQPSWNTPKESCPLPSSAGNMKVQTMCVFTCAPRR